MIIGGKALHERFEILRVLGEGSIGMVFEAIDKASGARVAVKTLRFPTPEGLAQFKSEFREFQNLSHPNLVSLGELVGSEGQWYFTMELIDGLNFLEHVRRGSAFARDLPTLTAQVPPSDEAPIEPRLAGALDIQCLRLALRQLSRGLKALHDVGKVHRDIKPNNVLVARSGRLVILDYGLAADAVEHRSIPAAGAGEIVGTVAYMAPEQAAARHAGPAADWYAVGVLLFEALTGRLPYLGNIARILTDKQLKPAPRVLECAPAAPPDLAALAEALLQLDPNGRPTGAEVLAQLDAGGAETARTPPTATAATAPFVGRVRQLAQLERGLKDLLEGRRTLFTVAGGSGLGKTALVRHYTRRVRREHPDAWIIEGVCYEREAAPYKGFDGAVDVLSQLLLTLPKPEVQRLLPPDAGLLPGLFPVLGRVEAFAAVARPASEIDPIALRARLFRAMRELLRRIALARPVVFVIDDLQWADADTWELLEAVLGGVISPAVQWIVIIRSTPEAPAEHLHERLERLGGELSWVELHRLSPQEGEALARALLEQLGAPSHAAARLSAEGGGEPLFIDALARYSGGQARVSAMSLDDVLWARSRALEPTAQRILELVALSNGSLAQSVVARAAEVDLGLFTRQVGALRAGHLIRSTGVRADDLLAPFHDRVRAAVRAHLSPDQARHLHQRLGLSLEASQVADPEAMLWHWEQAGERTRAARFAVAAAELAEERLAFDRAVTLYEEALRLDPPRGGRRLELLGQLGTALTRAGRGAAAAERFLEAAPLAEPVAALELKRNAADQLLRSGHVDRGMEVLREVLRAVNVELPSTPARALLALALRRTRLKLRGLKYRERHEAQAAAVLRVDATWSAAYGLSMVDVITGAELQTQNLLQALELGEPRRIARALAMEAALRSTSGVSAFSAAKQLNDEAMRLAERLGEPYELGLVTSIDAVIHFQCGHWGAAMRAAERAHELLSKKGLLTAWELTTTRLFWLSALFYLGELERLLALLPDWRADSSRRGDRFAAIGLCTSHLAIGALLKDAPEIAAHQARRALEEWSGRGYLAQHYYALLTLASADLYSGDSRAAYRRVRDEWHKLRSGQLLRVQFLRIEATHLRARTAIAAGEWPDAASCARSLERERTPLATAFADAIGGACRLAAGDKAGASRALGRAAESFDAQQMRLYAAGARAAWGEVAQDERARQEAVLWFESRGAQAAERLVHLYVPLREG
jgi:hypothetical protein